MFKTKIFLMSVVAILGSALIGLMLSNRTDAANPEPVVVQVAFVAPILITETNPLEFGTIDVAFAAGNTIAIATDDTPTEVPVGRILGGTQASAKLGVTVTPFRPINILVTPGAPGIGYTIGSWTCDYDITGPAACVAPGLLATSVAGPGSVVRVGATITGNGFAVVGDQNSSFTLTVSYE